MKVLVTGATGQIGSELTRALSAMDAEIVAPGSRELDFTQPESVAEQIAAHGANWIVNCAAYTAVDQAEDDAQNCYLVNRDSARAVAEGAKNSGARLLHVSTDFIFDGKQSSPYSEDDLGMPLGVYGHSKWEGEQAVQAILPDAAIVRTAWVYGVHGHNFVKTILRLAAEREVLTVVDDQIGSPSYSADIAEAILKLLLNDSKGIFHFTNEGVASWYDFAHRIIEIARELGFPIRLARVTPVPTSAYKTIAIRPAYSVLSKEKIRPLFKGDIRHWVDSLKHMLARLRQQQA